MTATDTDTSNLSTSQTFTWQVTCAPPPHVILAINGTLDPSDDVVIVGAMAPTPVVVTLENASPGLHQVQISIPSGLSQVNQTTLELANGGSATIYLTALQSSVAENDVQLLAFVDGALAGDAKETNEDITFPAVIENSDTPAAMPPRIPLGNSNGIDWSVKTPVQVTLSVPLVRSGEKVTLGVNYYGPRAETGTIAFVELGTSSQLVLTKSEEVWIIGTSQTQPGSAGNISLDASGGVGAGVKGKESSKFSVASIPIAVWMKKPTQGKGSFDKGTPGPFWGAVYPISIVSDSGNPNDLNDIQVSEYVHYEVHTGIWNLATDASMAWYSAAGSQPFPSDHNGTFVGNQKNAAAGLQKAIAAYLANGIESKFVMQQVFIYSDERTGAGIPTNAQGSNSFTIAGSGFQITAVAVKDGNNYSINVTREAKDETVQPNIEIGRDKNLKPIMKELAARTATPGYNDSSAELKDPVQ